MLNITVKGRESRINYGIPYIYDTKMSYGRSLQFPEEGNFVS